MLSASMSPYLDAELAYRLERIGAHVPHEPLTRRRAHGGRSPAGPYRARRTA